MTCMFLGYARHNMGGIYQMLNLRTNSIFLIPHVIWVNKTYGEYISRLEHTKDDSYILLDK